jgi:ribonuclease G
MAKNLLVINVDLRETRVALIEDGIIAELHVERVSTRSTLGNIVLGKVSRVLPGMQAAFIDIGQERAAFLHVEDLIRPDDFEAYLSGGKRPDEEENIDEEADEVTEVQVGGPAALAAAPAPRDATPAAPSTISLDGVTDADRISGPPDRISGPAADELSGSAEAGADHDDSSAELDAAGTDDADELNRPSSPDDALNGELSATATDELDELEDLTDELEIEPIPGVEAVVDGAMASELSAVVVESAAQPQSGSFVAAAPAAVAPARTAVRANAAGARPSPNEGGADRTDPRTFRTKRVPRTARQAPQKGQRPGRGKPARGGGNGAGSGGGTNGTGGRNGQRDASRLSRSTPIREVVREGQEVIVQVSKEPIGTKGARVTSHISLPGRYVVYMPTLDQIGISKRIGSEKERARLREAIESIKPPTGGLIVRTVAEGLTKKQLKADVGYLVRLWEEVGKNRDAHGKAPALLYQELDLVLKTARDLFTDEVEQIVIDDKEQYQRLVRFVEMFMPERVKDIVCYTGDEPVFDAYGIEDEIGRALSRKVPLPSGGHLIIDQAEALTAIDVNTGRYVGKGSKDLEDTLFKTNLEAVEEIAYQLRFRNLGGLIVLDLIDMERAQNREKVRRRLEELLQKDKAKTTLNRISDLGLIEMTRKRTRESLGRLLHEPCFYCDGTGQLQSKPTVVYEILRQLRRERTFLPGYSIVVSAHPAVIDLMKGEEREAVQEAERRYMRRIELIPRKEYHLEQFDLAGK